MTHVDTHLWIRMKQRCEVFPKQIVRLKDIAQLLAPERYEDVAELVVYEVPTSEHLIVLDVFDVVKKIAQRYPLLQVEAVGNTDTVLEVKRKSRSVPRLAVLCVWLLLFVGSGLAIINFHTDVSMPEVHQRLYYLLTGRHTERPLWIQIPYSLGIGIGMLLFFNHLFKHRFNEEPSPLEVEMNLYQENIDRHIVRHEKSKGNDS